MELDQKEIGKRIRKARKEKGEPMKWLAEIIGVSEQAISQYELGKRPMQIGTVQKIATALDVDVKYLLYGEPQKLVLTTPDGQREEFTGHIEEWQVSIGNETQEPPSTDVGIDELIKAAEDYEDAEEAYTADSSNAQNWIDAGKRVTEIINRYHIPSVIADDITTAARRKRIKWVVDENGNISNERRP